MNYRVIGCNIYGVNCGCVNQAMKDNINEFFNNPDTCIEKCVADELTNEGKLKKISTYIGGMVDAGRGGFIHGEHVVNGQPSIVMKEHKAKNPKTNYLCVHEESGQFQTYWSLYEVVEK